MNCTHERIKTWLLADTHEPAGLWSCAHCGEKFMPITMAWAESRKRAEDMRESFVNAIAAKYEKHRGEPIAICGANRKNTASERYERRQGCLSGMLVAQYIIRALPVDDLPTVPKG